MSLTRRQFLGAPAALAATTLLPTGFLAALAAETSAADWAFQIAEVHAWRGDKDQAFQWLERAYAQHDGGLSDLKFDPLLAGLRGDKRFAARVSKMGLGEARLR